jgi:hypothetical protein
MIPATGGSSQPWCTTPHLDVTFSSHLLAAAQHHHAPTTVVVESIRLERHDRVHCGSRQFRSRLGEEEHAVISRLIKDRKDDRQGIDAEPNAAEPTGAKALGTFRCRKSIKPLCFHTTQCRPNEHEREGDSDRDRAPNGPGAQTEESDG